jgi:hypothetical protein
VKRHRIKPRPSISPKNNKKLGLVMHKILLNISPMARRQIGCLANITLSL